LAAGATAVLFVALLGMRPGLTLVGDENSSGQERSPPNKLPHAAFVAAAQRALKKYDERLVELVKCVVDDVALAEQRREESGELQHKVAAAKNAYETAKLDHEIARLAVKEYKNAISWQERASLDAEYKRAKDEVDRSVAELVAAKDHHSKISQLADSSAAGLHLKYACARDVGVAEREARRAALELERAELRRKDLTEYAQLKRNFELDSAVKGAHALELAKEADWERTNRRADAEKARNADSRRSSENTELLLHAVVERAVNIEDQVRGKLHQLASEKQSDDPIRAETGELLNQLDAVLDDAEAARMYRDLTRLKLRMGISGGTRTKGSEGHKGVKGVRGQEPM
jgi:hypothetical protein